MGVGALEYRGQFASTNAGWPRGVDYAFLNHGHVVPISREFYEYVRDADILGGNLFIVEFLAMIPALIAYAILIHDQTGDASNSKALMFFSLFFPRNDDPFITKAGKCFVLLRIASFNRLHVVTGTVFGLYPLPLDPGGVVSRTAETAFIEYVWRTHTVCIVLGLIVALVHGHIVSLRRRSRGAEESALDSVRVWLNRGTSMSKLVKSEASRGAGCFQTPIRHSATVREEIGQP